jgi:hypothetical protein
MGKSENVKPEGVGTIRITRREAEMICFKIPDVTYPTHEPEISQPYFPEIMTPYEPVKDPYEQPHQPEQPKK